MPITARMAPCLWFAHEAEEAATYYVSIFPHSRINSVVRYSQAGYAVHRRPADSVMSVAFELDGQPFTALNGGPVFRFNEAVSFEVYCENQQEIDYYWDALSSGGDPKAQRCGWLKDKYGLSWQIVPRSLAELIKDSDSPGAARVMTAVLQMTKLNLAAIERAHAGDD